MSNPASFVTAASIDSGNAFVGAQSITGTLAVSGACALSSTLAVAGVSALTTTTCAPTVSATGVRAALTVTGAVDTGRTASTEQPDVLFDGARTVTWATGALTAQRSFKVMAQTLAFVGASTVSVAATVYIDRAPQAGANATITSALALWVNDGDSRFDGAVGVGGAPAGSAALTVTSTTQGLLFPRMTEVQRDAIATPAAGLVVYNTTTGKLNLRVAAAWEAITSA